MWSWTTNMPLSTLYSPMLDKMANFCLRGVHLCFKRDVWLARGMWALFGETNFNLRQNSSHSYERARSFRSHAWALFFCTSGTMSFSLFPPGLLPNPSEKIKVIFPIWGNGLKKKKKFHCCFIYLLCLIDRISCGAKKESYILITSLDFVVKCWTPSYKQPIKKGNKRKGNVSVRISHILHV